MIDCNGAVSGLKRNPRLGIIHGRIKPHTEQVVIGWAFSERAEMHLLPAQSPDQGPLGLGHVWAVQNMAAQEHMY